MTWPPHPFYTKTGGVRGGRGKGKRREREAGQGREGKEGAGLEATGVEFVENCEAVVI